MKVLDDSIEYVGFTEKQKEWIRTRDNNQCIFRQRIDGEWIRCNQTEKLHIHHIIPRNWCRWNIPYGFEVNGPNNGVTLCAFHHVGYGASRDAFVFVIHPDVEPTRQAYINGTLSAYEEMKEQRMKRIQAGTPYWNTSFDWYFLLYVQSLTTKPSNYPDHRKFGRLGA